LREVIVKYSISIIMILMVLVGCGLKGNPIPYPILSKSKPVIKDIQAVSEGDAVILKWNLHDKDGLANFIGIERSEVGTPGNECKDCPRIYAKVGQISVKEVMQVEKEQKALSFTDNKVVKGKIYNYRLMLCDNKEICSEASAIEINHK
jgi:predicted small lipoprotein YifL